MRKRITILLAAVLVLCLLAGCQSAEDGINQNALTQQQREAISAAYAESKVGAEELYWFQTDGLGAYYLGEVEGCIIFYNLRTWKPSMNEHLEYGDITTVYRPERIRMCEFTLLGNIFAPAFENQLCAYKDGKVCCLSRAWAKGWISKEGVQQVKEAYDAFIRYLVAMGESGYLKNEKKFFTLMQELSGLPMDDPDYVRIMQRTRSEEYQLLMKALEG